MLGMILTKLDCPIVCVQVRDNRSHIPLSCTILKNVDQRHDPVSLEP